MDYFTPEEIAQKLKVKVSTVWRWIRTEKMPAVKIGKSYRISEDQLDKFLKSLEVGGDNKSKEGIEED